jgi:hypothetical protein
MNKLKLAEQIGIKILDREHEAVMAYVEDDSEYIPRLKRLIDSISIVLLDNGFEKQTCADFQKKLYDYAKGLYLKSWMIHAEEQEGPGNFNLKAEQKRAYKTFDEHFLE